MSRDGEELVPSAWRLARGSAPRRLAEVLPVPTTSTTLRCCTTELPPAISRTKIVDRRPLAEVGDLLGERQFGDDHLVSGGHAGFSYFSALSRVTGRVFNFVLALD